MILILTLACGVPEAPPGAAVAAAPAPAATAAVRQTDVSGLNHAMGAGRVFLVDVRTPGEYAAGHVPGAVNVPLDQLDRASLAGHEQEDVYVICEVGGRSAKASRSLAAWGYRPVNVDGGTAAWRSAGLPVE